MKRNLSIQLGWICVLGITLLAAWLTSGGQIKASEAASKSALAQHQVNLDPLPTREHTIGSASTQIPVETPQVRVTNSPQPEHRETSTAAAPAPETSSLDPADWQNWPVLPRVRENLRYIYDEGLEQGNDPHAFSILGDCQSQPDVFLGILDDDPSFVAALPNNLQETVAHFSGSFDRYSPTVKDGTTEGALLWIQWNDNKEKKCTSSETPLDCELRVHKPSIVFIHVGTHNEARNRQYLITILEKILKAKAIPVLVTKADNLEKDMHINAMIARLAYEYNLPLWNFWSSVQDLPNHGLKIKDSKYLTPEGIEIHRMGALEALDSVWRALK